MADFTLLVRFLRREGPLSPATLIERLNISQPTLFRAVKAHSQEIAALGGRRNRKLAALRDVRNMGASIPLFRVSAEGELSQIASLLNLYPRSSVVVMNSMPTKPLFYPGLPFYIDDVRPQGFLGKGFSQKHPDLKLPTRTVDWNNDDILEAVANRGEDLPGNSLVGALSFERYQTLARQKPEMIDPCEIEKSYERLAQAAIDGESAGSSAGGEHPKFTTIIQDNDKKNVKRVIVKFSPSKNSFAAQRWHDLLVSEWWALEVLRQNQIPAAESRIIESSGRTFLETTRFDRVGLNGRVGVLSLSAFENEWLGHGENWAVSAALLESQKRISKENLNTIQILECFGRLIANSDRHPGNLSFFWEPGESQAKLAPVYDMLPMLYAPSGGGEDTRKTFAPPTYDHTLLTAWKAALPIATQYWERVCEDSRLSPSFRKIAEENRRVVCGI